MMSHTTLLMPALVLLLALAAYIVMRPSAKAARASGASSRSFIRVET